MVWRKGKYILNMYKNKNDLLFYFFVVKLLLYRIIRITMFTFTFGISTRLNPNTCTFLFCEQTKDRFGKSHKSNKVSKSVPPMFKSKATVKKDLWILGDDFGVEGVEEL